MEEIEQHNKELCKENQKLKDSCVSLKKQNSDMQAELQKNQVWMLVKGELGVWRSELDGASYPALSSVLLVMSLPYTYL